MPFMKENLIKNATDLLKYAKNFDTEGLWDTIRKYAKIIGRETVKNILILYYTLQNPDVPKKVRAIIYGALGYFILPIDIIPDFIPIAGMTDDIAVVAAAIAFISQYVTQREKDMAEAKVQEWFG